MLPAHLLESNLVYRLTMTGTIQLTIHDICIYRI